MGPACCRERAGHARSKPGVRCMTSSKPMDPRTIVLFAFGVAIALYLAWLLRDVLVVIYVSALFAVVLMPLVRGVMKLHIGRGIRAGAWRCCSSCC